MDPWADSPLKLLPLPGRLWKLARDYTVRVPDGPTITVPEGFICDLASVPRPFWWYAPPYGNYTSPALVHDYLYAKTGEVLMFGLTRCEADMIFLRHMRACGVRPTQAYLKYIAVRLFGWVVWNRNRRLAHVG